MSSPGFVMRPVLTPMQIGRLIRTARQRRGLSQYDLADRAGIEQSSLVNIENGATQQPKHLAALYSALSLEGPPPVIVHPLGPKRPDSARVSVEGFRAWLRDAVPARGLTQAALAADTGVSTATISRLLDDRPMLCRLDLYERLRAVLGDEAPDPDKVEAVADVAPSRDITVLLDAAAIFDAWGFSAEAQRSRDVATVLARIGATVHSSAREG